MTDTGLPLINGPSRRAARLSLAPVGTSTELDGRWVCYLILTVFGNHFYKTTEEGGVIHVLISKRKLIRTDETTRVTEIVDFILIEDDHRKAH